MLLKRSAGRAGIASHSRPGDAAILAQPVGETVRGRPDDGDAVRILLVDDDTVDRMAIERYIHEQRLAYQLVQTSSVAEARAQLAGAAFDVAILDYLLRDGTGLDILAELHDTPAIILTGSGREAIAAQAIRLGASDYLIKDTDRAYLTMLPATVLNALERKRDERRASALQQLHTTILSATGQGIVGVSWQGRIQFANPAAEDLLGYACDELVGMAIERLWPGQDTAEDEAWERHPIVTCCRSGERYRADDAALRRRDGAALSVAYTATPWRDTGGQVIGAVVVFEDITQRKQAEEALRQSEERFRALTEHGTDLVCILAPNGTARYASPSYTRVLGAPLDELHRRAGSPLGVIHPEDRAGVQAAMEACVRDGVPATTLTCRHRHADGSWRTLEAVATNCLADPAIRGVVVTSRDVTARKQVEEALRESEERFRLLFSEAPTGIALAAPDGRLLAVNQSLCNMLGHSERELLDLGTPILTHPDDVAESRALIGRLLAGEVASAALEKRYLRRDGHVVWVHYSASLLRDASGRPLYFIFHLLDITARKAAEAALRRSEERFRSLLEAAPDAIVTCQADGRMVLANAQAERLFGYRRDELIGQPVEMLLPAARREQHSRHRAGYAADPRTRPMGSGLDLRARTKTGDEVPVEISLSPVAGEAEGLITAIIRDVSTRRAMEEALRGSEERFRTLIEKAPVGACLTDEHGVFQVANEALHAIYGYAPGELIGRHVSVVIPPGQRDASIAQQAARIASGESTQHEYAVVTKGGEALTVLASTVQIADVDGRPRRASFAIDISERARMEQALREAEERLRAMHGAMACGVLVFDASGEVVEVNAAGQEIIGLQFDALRQRFVSNGHVAAMLYEDGSEMPPEQRPSYRALMSGAPERDVIMGFRRLDGGERWVQMDAVPMLDHAGAVRHVVVSFTDVTARRRAEAALRASEERFRTLIAHAPVGAAVADEHGLLELVNDTFAAIYGYAPEEMVGQPITQLVPAEQRAALAAAYADYVASGVAVRDEYAVVTRDGEQRTVLGQSVQYDGPDGRPRRATFSLDITARARLEAELRTSHAELARSNAELEQFTRVASHDLRSPLSSIGGFAQLFQLRYHGRLDATADEYIDFITTGVARMQALIDALLSYARLDSQARPHVAVDCATLVRDALANLHAAVEEADAVVETGELPTVRGDAAQLGQVVQNLVGNALKFRRPDVAPWVRISAERDAALWRLTVRDNGIGIDPARAGRVFEMFGRLHTREEYEGTGIGLALCQKIVERHGGRIWLESEPGAGAAFHFTLPAG